MGKRTKKGKLYYIKNGYVGNAVLWWGKDGRGYTTEIENAGKYTKEETDKIIERPEDIAWECEYVDTNTAARKTIIDGQYLNPDFRVLGKTK
jgi:hypothetical protein